MLSFPSQRAQEFTSMIVSIASALTLTQIVRKWAQTHGARVLETAANAHSRLCKCVTAERLKSRVLRPRVFPAAGSVTFPRLTPHH